MIAGETILSSAYFPPVKYVSHISGSSSVLIEHEENYIKQSFRNRCIILGANGPQMLSVPVLEGSFHKRAIKDIRIDYSRRWKQVHLRSITAAYRSSPFFEYYFGDVERVINNDHKFLIDLNSDSLTAVLKITGITTTTSYTSVFNPVNYYKNDFRYTITPKGDQGFLETGLQYIQVFGDRYGFTDGLSILDLIFNTGPDSGTYLKEVFLRI